MKINRHNYEAFLLDQLEGRLSVEQQQELEHFLRLNPDCAGEITELESCLLEDRPLPHPHSAGLKKGFPNAATVLTDENFDMFSIARLEQDLADEQIREHQAMLDVDEKKAAQWIQWQQSRLIPETIAFPGKKGLLRRTGTKSRLIWMSIVSAAAVITLMLILIGRDQDLPSREAYVPALEETESEQAQDLQTQNVIIAEESAPLPEERPVVRDVPPMQRITANPDPAAANQSAAQAVEEPALPEEVSGLTNTQVFPGAISALQLNSSSIIGEVDADRIEPLDISPIPVQKSSLTLAQIYDQGLQELAEEYVEENDISLLTIANAGIKGINKLAGADISLLASRDEEGDISGFRLKSKRFSITRPLGKED